MIALYTTSSLTQDHVILIIIGGRDRREEMEKDQGASSSPSHSNPSRSPAYSPTLSDTKIRSPANHSPDQKEQRRSMSVDSIDSSNSKHNTRSFRSSRSGSREGSLHSIEIKGLTKMVYATHLEQIFAAYGPIEEIFMPSDPHSQENMGRAFIIYKSPSSAEKAEDCMDKGQIDGAIVSVRCEDVRLHELRSSYNPTPRSQRRDTIRTSNDYRYRNKDDRQRYPVSSYDRERRSEGHRRSRSASPY